MTDTAERPSGREAETITRVVVRFAGDSGDGMQLTGDRFTSVSATFGNDLSTLPEYPAEIRAPAGTVNGVSSFQVQISDHDITTPGDEPSVLIAMNPAALKADLGRLEPHGLLIVNSDAFQERDLAKAGYAANPLTDDSLLGYRVVEVPMTSLTQKATEPLGVKPRDAERSKNFFALGLVSWLYLAPDATRRSTGSSTKFKDELVRLSNVTAFNAGYNFGETTEQFEHRFEVKPAKLPPGEYTNISGNVALAWGLVAAGQLAKLPVFLGSYPITPAQRHPPRALQAQALRCAHRAGRRRDRRGRHGAGRCIRRPSRCHRHQWPGRGPEERDHQPCRFAGVAVPAHRCAARRSVHRPADQDRGSRSQHRDLRSPQRSPACRWLLPSARANCFDAAIEAARIALKYRTPVILLSDGYIANGSEPWRLPDVASLPDISVPFATEMNHTNEDGTEEFWPYLRDPETLARPWAIPGTPGLMHRVGGLEKEDGRGDINYTPENHQRMVDLRAAKIAGIANDIPLAVESAMSTMPTSACSAGARLGLPSTLPCSARVDAG